MYKPTKKYLRKKAKQLCIMGEIVIESRSFLKILTEPWWTLETSFPNHLSSLIINQSPI